jgi:hypothetical protein
MFSVSLYPTLPYRFSSVMTAVDIDHFMNDIVCDLLAR